MTQTIDEQVEKIYHANADMVRENRLEDFREFIRASLKPAEDPMSAHCQDIVLQATIEGMQAYNERLNVKDTDNVVCSYHPSGYVGFVIMRNIANLHKEGEKVRESLR